MIYHTKWKVHPNMNGKWWIWNTECFERVRRLQQFLGNGSGPPQEGQHRPTSMEINATAFENTNPFIPAVRSSKSVLLLVFSKLINNYSWSWSMITMTVLNSFHRFSSWCLMEIYQQPQSKPLFLGIGVSSATWNEPTDLGGSSWL